MSDAVTTTKERPILFSGPMVRAILDGRKTQTRRIIKPQPTQPLAGHVIYSTERSQSGKWRFAANDDHDGEYRRCPYGLPHDRLWVRETWTPDHGPFYPHYPILYRAEGYDPLKDQEPNEKPGHVYSPEQKRWFPFKWRPSIFMPRSQCRIVLEITSVRVERLNEITEEDAEAEGFDDAWLGKHRVPPPRVMSFRHVWDDINGADSWSANPWVWRIEFKRLKIQ